MSQGKGRVTGKEVRELLGAISGRALHVIIRTNPRKLLSENPNLFCHELGKRMDGVFSSVRSCESKWGMRNLAMGTSFPGHLPANRVVA